MSWRPEKASKRVRYRGKLLRDHVTGHLPPRLRAAAWQRFLQLPLAGWARWVISETEPQEVGLFRRRTRRPKGWQLFDDLPFDQLIEARQVFDRLCAERNLRLPEDGWLVPILAGRARDLVLRPDAHGSEWGLRNLRRLRGKRSWQKRLQRDCEAARHHMREISRMGVKARALKRGQEAAS